MAASAHLASCLDRLAASRQSGSHSITILERGADCQGRLQTTVQCRTAADSPVASLLLSAFQEATTPAARARGGQGPLPRGVEIAVAQAAAPPAVAAAGRQGGEQQPSRGPQLQEQQGVSIQFTATEPAAEAQVEEAARLFEAYWQAHVKATKSDLHCHMRQRLGALRQQLLLARLDGP